MVDARLLGHKPPQAKVSRIPGSFRGCWLKVLSTFVALNI